MNIAIKKILFPVDFSRACLGASRYIEAMAGHYQAEVMLVHAIGMGEHNLAETLLPKRKAELDEYLRDELKYLTTQRVCVLGEPASAVCEAARSWNPDLVMMPTHGLGYFRRHLLGSVTSKLLHDLPTPIWTSVHAERAPRLEDIHVRNVLCAVDLGDRSPCVLEWAAALAAEFGATLSLAYAAIPLDPAGEGWALDKPFVEYVTQQAERRLEALQHQTGVATRAFVDTGDPSLVVPAFARKVNADLLVLGRHERKGFAGALFQHAYSIIRESPCPVISI